MAVFDVFVLVGDAPAILGVEVVVVVVTSAHSIGKAQYLARGQLTGRGGGVSG